MGPTHETADNMMEVIRFQLDRQIDGKTETRVWRVDADPRRLMKPVFGVRFSHQVEGAGHRLIEGHAVQFVDRDLRPVQRESRATTPTPTDRYDVVQTVLDDFMRTLTGASLRAGM